MEIMMSLWWLIPLICGILVLIWRLVINMSVTSTSSNIVPIPEPITAANPSNIASSELSTPNVKFIQLVTSGWDITSTQWDFIALGDDGRAYHCFYLKGDKPHMEVFDANSKS